MKERGETTLQVLAKAKINLALHVTGVLPNGLHSLDSLVAFPEVGDTLTFEEAEGLSLTVKGPFGPELLEANKNSKNLVMSAAQLMMGPGNGVSISLIKNLPLASGIGGGSSDAASTLRALATIWNKSIPDYTDILKLGSDVPVCLSYAFQRLQGIGDQLTQLPLPSLMWIVLVNPGIQVPTSKIFSLLENKINQPLERLGNLDNKSSFFDYLKRQRNDLQGVTCKLFPEVKNLLEFLTDTEHCKLARMSGSGATCFGLYSEKSYAVNAAKSVKNVFPDFWVEHTKLFSSNSRNNEVS